MIRVLLIAAALAAAGAVAFVVFRPPSPEDPSTVLARVGDEVITVAEFVEEMDRRGGRIPGQFRTVEQRQALLEAMIQRKLMVAGARAAGYDRDEEVVRMAEKILVDRYRDAELDERIEEVAVSEGEVEAYYREHLDRYTRAPQRRAAIIEMHLPPRASEEYRDQVRARVDEVVAGVAELPQEVTHFGRLAREYSEDRSSRYQGGVIGWLEPDPARPYKWGEEVLAALYALDSVGEVSEPLEVGDRIYLVRFVAERGASVMPLERVADGIRHLLERDRREQVLEDFLASIRQGVPMDVNDELLAGIQPLSGPASERERRPPAGPTTGNAN